MSTFETMVTVREYHIDRVRGAFPTLTDVPDFALWALYQFYRRKASCRIDRFNRGLNADIATTDKTLWNTATALLLARGLIVANKAGALSLPKGA